MAGNVQRAGNSRLVVGITGRIGSGKTSLATYLTSSYGFQYLRYSQILSKWRIKDPESKARLQEIGWQVMSGGMQAELNRRLISEVDPDNDVVLDGLRHLIDYESLKKRFTSSLHLLYIESPPEVRWDRLKKCGRYTDFGLFETADSHAVELQIETLRPKAEWEIRNEGSLQDLYAVVDEKLRGFRREGNL